MCLKNTRLCPLFGFGSQINSQLLAQSVVILTENKCNQLHIIMIA